MTDAPKTKTAPEGEKALKPLSRAEALARVKADPLWDVVVVGGGELKHRGSTEEIFPLIMADTLGSCPVLNK